MKTEILKPNSAELKPIIQYFIIFKSGSNENIDYTTFPNTNLCLAIYKQNKIVVEQNAEGKHLFTFRGDQTYKSYLSGFHESNLKVSVHAPLDEVCIIFHPGALRLFSNISYDELVHSDEVFKMLFPRYADFFVEQLFEEGDSRRRVEMLENIFLKSLTKDYLSDRAREALFTIDRCDDLKVKNIAKELSMDKSTLYRLFMDQIGQNPKSFLKTVRFRKALNGILQYEKPKLTEVAYENNYTDQSHFIRDFKEITGQSPSQLRNKTSIQQEELAWIYSQH